jgi:hypothetical protein
LEEGLKVILSADVSQFEAAFARATQATGRSIQLINNNLKGAEGGFSALASTTNKLIPSWTKFSSIFMNPFKREFGGHTKEMMAALSEAYTRIQQGTMTMSQLLQVTQFTGKEMEGLGVKLASIPVDNLTTGLNRAEKVLNQFAQGARPLADLRKAVEQLQGVLPGLANTAPVEKLILSLQQLQATGKGMNVVGLDIRPEVHVADTLKDIANIKGLIASEQFEFVLTADSKALTQAMQSAVNATDAGAEAIERSTQQAGQAFVQMGQTARSAVVDYVKALAGLNNVPTAVKTTVQAPDMTPVIEAVRRVKSEISAATVATLPKLTLSADTTPFTQALLSTKAVSQETWAAIKQTFTGVDAAIKQAADNAKISIQQLVQNFNALKGVGPQAVVMQVKPPNYEPVIAAAKVAKRRIDQVFLTPLPQIKPPQFPSGNGVQQFANQLHNANGVGMQFNHLLREMPNFAIDARIGVMSLSNNLPYFVDAVQNARKSGQGFGAIMSSIGSSMFSVGGIAVLAVTAFTAFAGSMRKSKDETKSAEQVMDEYVESLDAVNKARLKGEQSGAKELVNLRLLYDATQNHSLSLAERKKAVDALQQQYPAYFKNISDEIILAGQAKGAYDDLTAAILRKAKAESAQDELKTLASTERTLKAQRKDSAQEFFNAASALKKAQADVNKAKDANLGGPALQGLINLQTKAQDRYNEAREKALGLGMKLTANLEDQNGLLKEIASYGGDVLIPKNTAPEIKPKADTEEAEDALQRLADFVKNIELESTIDVKAVPVIHDPTDWVGEYRESLKQQFEKEIDVGVTLNFTPDQIKANALAPGVDKVFTDYIEKFREAKVDMPQIDPNDFIKEGGAEELDAFLSSILKSRNRFNVVMKNWKEDFANAGLKFPAIDISNLSPEKLNNVYRAVYSFATNVNNVLSSAINDGFSTLGQTIGDALAGADITSGVQGILGILGDAVTAIGKALIEYGVIKEGLDKILAGGIAIPGMVAIAAGVAAVAAGQLVKNSFKPRKFEDGGIAYGPVMGLMGEYAGASSNPEVIAPLNKLKDLIGNSGGDKFPAYLPMHTIKGSELKLWYARAERQGNRYS